MGYKVLLADDSITVQKIVKLSLIEEGIEVIAFGNGEQAVSQIESLQPDLVMADVFMPGKDGYEVCEYIKAHPHFNHVPVILLVHAFEPFDPERAKEAGADHQLTKPFQSIRTLVTTVRDLLARAEVRTQSAVAGAPATAFSETPSPVVPLTPAQPAFTATEEEFPALASFKFGMESDSTPVAFDAAPGTVVEETPAGSFSLSAPATGFSSDFAFADEPVPAPASPASVLTGSELMPPLDLPALPEEPPAMLLDALDENPITDFTPSSESPLSDDVLDIPEISAPTPAVESDLTFVAASSFNSMADAAVLASFGATPTESILPFATDDAAPAYSSATPGVDLEAGSVELSPPQPEETVPPAQDCQVGASMTPSAAGLPLSEAVIEEIVNRVIQRLSSQAIQEIAWEVVPEMAELMIRRQITQQKYASH